MATAVAADSPARAVQSEIDVLQADLHRNVGRLVVGGNVKKNVHYEARHAVISQAIADGKLPRTFWADAIIAVLETPGADAAADGRLLGTYDVALLREYLKDMKVTYTEVGVRVTLVFAPNPFFEETELWGEERQLDKGERKDKGEEDDGDNDDDDDDDVCCFSGITWKPGHGPDLDEEENDDEGHHKANNNNNNTNKDKDAEDGGRKRERSETSTRGWSFLDVFSAMLPHPEEDEELDEEDDDELADAVERWEAEMDDRKDLLMTLVEEVWMNPVAALTKGKGSKKGDAGEAVESGSAAKRAKTE
ncbi:hypothetical protein DQ04_03761040 [Trypanosoma grayi]|uniref:hypothetical protein n=1 Tax=Trypanosoma grayi TaxID=71804 RepID=UPI0004F48797|nr:hypothetical protein DQ04_03761040 [Trypanosoma grayi]KEG10395.1 hypothetical protein DQ04_03761040 [Trypanosoma grayi]